MKILEVIQSLGSGGAERLVVDLCNELSKKEDVTLLLLKDADHFYLNQVSSRVKIIQAKMPIGTNFKQLWQCVKLIIKIDPDIVHYHSKARYTIILANILLRNRYKFFQTIHNDVYTGYRKGVSGIQIRIAGFLGKTRFITISKTNEDQFKNLYPKFFSTMIQNGRALPQKSGLFNEVANEIEEYKQSSNTIVFLHVARCQEQKHQELLIESFNKLINDGYDAVLLIIGAGFDSERGIHLKNIACEKVHFLSLKPNVYDYMLLSDVFCLSSLYEGMPITIIEAVLCGLPIVSTPVSGAVDFIRDGENGFLSKSHSENDFYKALLSFIKNKDRIKSNAKNEMNVSPCSIENCANEHIKWFSLNVNI